MPQVLAGACSTGRGRERNLEEFCAGVAGMAIASVASMRRHLLITLCIIAHPACVFEPHEEASEVVVRDGGAADDLQIAAGDGGVAGNGTHIFLDGGQVPFSDTPFEAGACPSPSPSPWTSPSPSAGGPIYHHGSNCLGECGIRCKGVRGTHYCTPECLTHDECTRCKGALHPDCLASFGAAIASWYACYTGRRTDCGCPGH